MKSQYTPSEIRKMKKSMDEIETRRRKYPNCKHPHNRVRPLVVGHSMLWCSLCWEAWEPEPWTIPVGTVEVRPRQTVTIAQGAVSRTTSMGGSNQ